MKEVNALKVKEQIVEVLKEQEDISLSELLKKLKERGFVFSEIYAIAYLRAIVEWMEAEGLINIIKVGRAWIIRRRD